MTRPAADALRGVAAGEPEQALKGGHRCPSPVEAELELADVGRDVLGTDAVVGPGEPGLEVREDAVDARQEVARVSLASLNLGLVVVAQGLESLVAREPVGEHGAAFHDIALDESLKSRVRGRRDGPPGARGRIPLPGPRRLP